MTRWRAQDTEGPGPRSPCERLAEVYPGTAKELCALDPRLPFQLLAATILSAQSTDARVNMVTPAALRRLSGPGLIGRAPTPRSVEEIIHSTGFFRAKTRSLIGMATAVVERFGGEVPTALDDLVTIPGVGRKTGNVVRSVAFGLPGLPVDTHVLRLSKRLTGAAAKLDDPVKVEHELNAIVPPAERGTFSLRMILHGRAVCVARRPGLHPLHPGRYLPFLDDLRPAPSWSRADSGPSGAAAAHGGRPPESDIFVSIPGVVSRRSLNPGITLRTWNRFPPPGSGQGRRWDPPPGGLAQCRPSGRHRCYYQVVRTVVCTVRTTTRGRCGWYYSRCYHSFHGDQAFGFLG